MGNCIEKARPYYEARRLAKEVPASPRGTDGGAGVSWGFLIFVVTPFPLAAQAQQETQKAALRYERAVSMHNAAREMVFVAEQGVMADKNRLDPTWQEMLNHATCKVWGRQGGSSSPGGVGWSLGGSSWMLGMMGMGMVGRGGEEPRF